MHNLLLSCTLPVLPISSIGCSLVHVRATPGVADDAASTLQLRTSSQLCHGQSATLIHSSGASDIFNRLLSCACPCNFRCSRCRRFDSILEIFRHSKLLADCAWKVSKQSKFYQFDFIPHSYYRETSKRNFSDM